jgi:hypothetical protein
MVDSCHTIAPFPSHLVLPGATMEPHSTSSTVSRSRLLAFCTPELWIESSETKASSAIDHWQQNAFRQYVVQISVVTLANFVAGKVESNDQHSRQ